MNYLILAYINHFRQFHALIYEDLAAELKLNQLEIDILLFLHNNPEFNTARDIVTYRGFAKSNVSTAIDSLRQKGYVTVFTDPDSRKLQRLSLVPDKADEISRMRQCQKAEFALAMNGISDKDFQKMQSLIKQMDTNILTAIRETKNGVDTKMNGGLC